MNTVPIPQTVKRTEASVELTDKQICQAVAEWLAKRNLLPGKDGANNVLLFSEDGVLKAKVSAGYVEGAPLAVPCP